VAFFVLLNLAPRSLGTPANTSDYLLDFWTSDSGLPDSSVTAITQTPDGYLWLGTYNGLSRFDGVRFVDFDPLNTPELANARVDDLFVDAQGTLWINTHDGSMTACRHGVFTREWQGGQVSAVYLSAGRIYFALLRGQLVCRPASAPPATGWQAVQLAGKTSGNLFCQDAAGGLWYATRDGLLVRINGPNAEPVASPDFLPGERVHCLTTDGAGRLWLGTDQRLLLWQGNAFTDQTPTNGEPAVNPVFMACTVSNGCWVITDDRVRQCVGRRWVAEASGWRELMSPSTTFLHAYEDAAGGVWFRDFGRGLFHAWPDGRTQRISSAEGLPDNRVSAWFQDREGNIWAGMDRGGLVRLRQKRFQVLGAADGLTIPVVSTVCEDAQGDVWIGTLGGGLNRLRDGRLDRFDLPDDAAQGSFYSAYPDPRGRLWLSAGREDLFLLASNQFSQPVRSALVHGAKVILVDHQGCVWVGRQNGLACISNNVVIPFGAGTGLGRKDVRALAEDEHGQLWIGTGDSGLYGFREDKLTAYPAGDGVANQAIRSLLPDADGALWVGTFRGGLLRFKDGRFTRYTTQNGLPSDIICQLLDDGQGNLWVGSHQGIFYLSKAAISAFDRGEIPMLPCIAYGLFDGLPTLECSGNYQPACWHGHDGKLWFSTVKGLVSVRPQAVTLNHHLPPVVLEDVLVDGKSLARTAPPGARGLPGLLPPLLPAGLPPATALLIPPGRHRIDFHYTALSFAAPDKVRFRYRLAGLDEGWVDAEGKRSAHYGPLRPGDYQFQVIACNNDGLWNETGAGIALRVLPHFWETWWFAVLLLAAMVAAIFGAVRRVVTRHLRKKLETLRQQRLIERERERIARDIHDDLGAGLTQILLQSSLGRRAPPGQTAAHLEQISETAHELVGAMDEIVWAIDPENDTLDGLVTYVGKYFQEFVTRAQLRCRLDLPAQLPPWLVSAEIRHNLFLALKEVLNNVVKHAAATEVRLQLRTIPAGFCFVIKDDGRGLAASAAAGGEPSGRISSGHGLQNLVLRLEKIGGTCKITSAPGGGTEVELTVRLPAATNL
jgi:ligand-binding sensor domain-containing protein/signal transduction histidine kinase